MHEDNIIKASQRAIEMNRKKRFGAAKVFSWRDAMPLTFTGWDIYVYCFCSDFISWLS